MIYLVLTSSIIVENGNSYLGSDSNKRENEYIKSITETLNIVREYENIKVILVENNGERETYFDQFNGNGLEILYTTNNFKEDINKGVKELLDVKEVIEKYQIPDDDFVIKLTGRYYMKDSSFIDTVKNNATEYDAFVKFYNVCACEFQEFDCTLGLVCMTAKHWRKIEYLSGCSPEVSFARYVRENCRVKEISNLSLFCHNFIHDGTSEY